MAEATRQEVPVYIFLGLLESGKTTVIHDFLENNQFAQAECNLVILCEEGEEELDEDLLASSHSKVVIVEDESELTPKFFKELDEKYRPSSVLIEFNGMWNASEFMTTPLPGSWFEFQDIGLINAETFEVYQKNMKDRFMEVFRYSDVIIFNRCDEKTRQQDLRRNIRVVNRRAKVYFESENPDFIEEPPELPFKLDADPIVVDFDDYGALMADMQENPQHYNGKRIKTEGYIGAAMIRNEHRCVFGRMAMACCADDMMFLGFKATGTVFEKLDPVRKEKKWGEITGKVTTVIDDEGDLTALLLDIETFIPKESPKDATVYFN